MVRVYLRPMLPFGAWTSRPAPRPHVTLLPLCSMWSGWRSVAVAGSRKLTPVRPITVSHCQRMTGLAKAFYKNAVQSPPVRLTPSLKGLGKNQAGARATRLTDKSNNLRLIFQHRL